MLKDFGYSLYRTFVYSCYRLKETLEEHSGYNVMVIGYSLGAGICQLAVMELLAGEHKVRLIQGLF